MATHLVKRYHAQQIQEGVAGLPDACRDHPLEAELAAHRFRCLQATFEDGVSPTALGPGVDAADALSPSDGPVHEFVRDEGGRIWLHVRSASAVFTSDDGEVLAAYERTDRGSVLRLLTVFEDGSIYTTMRPLPPHPNVEKMRLWKAKPTRFAAVEAWRVADLQLPTNVHALSRPRIGLFGATVPEPTSFSEMLHTHRARTAATAGTLFPVTTSAQALATLRRVGHAVQQENLWIQGIQKNNKSWMLTALLAGVGGVLSQMSVGYGLLAGLVAYSVAGSVREWALGDASTLMLYLVLLFGAFLGFSLPVLWSLPILTLIVLGAAALQNSVNRSMAGSSRADMAARLTLPAKIPAASLAQAYAREVTE